MFTVCLSIGYFTGLNFVRSTTDLKPKGVEENYLGNESDEEATIMRFKKHEAEMLTTIHTHILSFSLIFFCLGFILLSIPFSKPLKTFLLVEPFVSTVLTFGSIWFLWQGYTWMKYIIIFSGSLLSLTYIIIVGIIIKSSIRKGKS